MSVSLLPVVADLEKPLGVVGTYAIEAFSDGPSHFVFIVDCPCVYRPAPLSRVFDETCSKIWNHKSLLQHVERDVRCAKEVPCIRCGEADVSDGEGWEIFGA